MPCNFGIVSMITISIIIAFSISKFRLNATSLIFSSTHSGRDEPGEYCSPYYSPKILAGLKVFAKNFKLQKIMVKYSPKKGSFHPTWTHCIDLQF